MVFSLEALHAEKGDCLLLRFGDAAKPRLIVIDGGPPDVYAATFKPRLEQLREEAGGELPIEILMVSHIDEDHISGILQLSQALIDDPELRGQYPVATLWHNAFDDVLAEVDGVAEVVEAGPEVVPASMELEVAGVEEGRELRDNARGLHWRPNDGFDDFVATPDGSGVVPDLDLAPLKLTVVGPRQAELDRLQKKWDEKVKELRDTGKIEVAAIDDPDPSPSNLSSIVCLAELDGKRMLLTGDALGTKVIEQLESAGLLPPDDGKMELDLLKLPHHGSDRNVDVDFFRRLPAKHLVISADGEHHNPDIETLEMISEARRDDDFTLYFTESTFKLGMGKKIEEFLERERKDGRSYGSVFLAADEPSLRIDLLDPPA